MKNLKYWKITKLLIQRLALFLIFTTLHTTAHSMLCHQILKEQRIATNKIISDRVINFKDLSTHFKETLLTIKGLELGFTKQSGVPAFMAQTKLLTGKTLEEITPYFLVDYGVAGDMNSVGNAIVAQTIILSGKGANEVVREFEKRKDASPWSNKTPIHNIFVQTKILTGMEAADVIRAFEEVTTASSDTRQLSLALSAQSALFLEKDGKTVKNFYLRFPYIPGITSSTVRAVLIQSSTTKYSNFMNPDMFAEDSASASQ